MLTLNHKFKDVKNFKDPKKNLRQIMSKSLLATNRLRLEDDKNLISLVQDYAKNKIPLNYSENIIKLSKMIK